jgi:hypothetical protein
VARGPAFALRMRELVGGGASAHAP